jgi:hypothetical protein
LLAQQFLRDGNAILDERGCGFHQARIAGRMTDVLSVSGIGADRIVRGNQMITERPPGISHIGLHRDRST